MATRWQARAVAACLAALLASSASVASADACYGQTAGSIVCASLSSYHCCSRRLLSFMPVASGAAVSVPSNQKCCNNQLVPASSSSCGSMCGGAATDGTVVCTSQTSFVTCSNLSPIVQALNCPQGTVCCAAANGVSACRYSWECTTQYTPPATTTTTYVPPPPPAPTYSGTYAQCSGKADGTLVCTSGNTLNYCLNGGLASAADQYCPAGLVCCPNLGRCDVAGCPQYAVAPPSASCAGVPDNNIVCKSATTFNICQNGAEVNSAPQSCQAGLVCCQGLNRCDVAGCASTATSPPVYTPGIPAVPTGSCTNKPDNYVVCTSATTFNICKSGAKPYADQTCQAGLICCEGAQRCDATCAAPYVPPPTTPAPSTPPTTYGSSCTGKPDGYVVCQSKTTLNYCLSGALVKAVDQSCPPGLECCQAQQACGYPGCSYTPPPKTCAGLKDNQIVCKSLTTFNICFNGVEASAVDQSCPATTVCCGNLNRCDVAGCAGTPSVVPPVSPPPPPPYNPNPNPAGCTGKKDNQIICRSTTTFNICHDGVFSGQDQKCPNKLVCCDNLNRCDYAGCVGTPSPIPQDGSSGSYTKTPQVKNSGGSCVGKADGYVTCTAPNTFNICAGGVKSGVWDQYCPAGLTCCEKTQSCESSCPSYVPPTPPAINCDGLADSTFVCTGGNTFTLCQGGLATPSQTCPSGLVCCSGKGKCDYPGCATTPYVPPTPSTPAYVPPVINCKGVPDGKIACASATSFRICQNGLPASSVDINCQPGLYCCANTNKCDVAGCPGAGYVAPAPVPYDPSVCQNVKDGNIYCTSANTFNMCQNGLPVSSSSQTCPPGLVCCAASNRCDVPGCPVSYGSVVAPTYSGGSTFKYAPIVVGLSVKSPSSITTCDCSGQPDNRLRCTSPTTFNFCYGQTPVTAYDQSCPAGLTCCEATQRCEASCSSAPPQYAPSPPVYTPSSGSLCSGISNNGVVCTGPTTFNICWNQTYASAVDQSCPSGQTCCSNTGRCDSADCPTSVTYAPPPYGPPHTCSGKKDNQIICTGSNTFKYCVNQQIYSSNDITCPAGLVCCEGTNRCDVAGCPGSAPTYTPPPTPAYIPPPVYAPSCSGAKDGSIICRSKTTFNYCKSGSVLNAADQSCPYGTVCCAQSNLCDYPGNCASVLPPSTIPTLPAPSCSSISDGGIACISLYQFRYCSKGAFVSSAPQTCAKGTVCCADSNRCDYLSNCKSVLPVAPPVDVPTYTTSSNICAGLPDNHVACVNTKSFSLCLNQVPSTGNQNCAAGTVCCGNACVYPDDPKCGGVPQNPCLSIPDGGMACSDTAKYVLCQNSSPITPSMPCAPGTVCCGNACVFSSDPMCATTPGPVCAPTQALPPPVYNPPPVVVPTNVGSCVGAADNNIVCTSSTTFNFCLNQKILPLTADQYCPTGTYCCQALQRCLRVGECPVNPNTPALPDKCTGLPDNAQLCVSATQFNLCWKGQFTTPIPQSCAFGTVCCSDSNKCLPQAQCVTQLPNGYVDPKGVQLLPIANVPTDYCEGVADGKMACVNPTFYAICKGNLPTVGLKSCPAGQVCCGNSCVDPQSALCQPCAGCKDQTIYCTSDTQYTMCKSGLSYTPPVSCPTGTYCCGNACVAPSHPMCARPASYKPPTITPPVVTPTPPVVVPKTYGTCAQCADNHIRCRSKTSFNYCLNQMFLTSPDFNCPEGTVCCADSNTCDYEYNCKQIYDPLCKGLADGTTLCIGSTAYKTCANGDFLPGLTTCASGYVCSAQTNKCEASLTYKTYSYILELPTDVSTTFSTTASNVCAGVADSKVACVNPSQFSICLGGLPTAAQSCPAGTKCCGDGCVFPSDAKCGTNICTNKADSSIACVSASTYSTCLNGYAITPPMPCPAGTVCCGNACVYSYDPLCANGGLLYTPPPNTYVSPPPQPITPPKYCQPDYVPGTYVPPAVSPCQGVPDMQIVCRSANTFNFCLNQLLISALDQYCAPGTVCCSGSSPNVCAKPGECPSTKPHVCSNKPNNQLVCVSNTQFNLCLNGVFASYAPQSCPAGTVCCADSNKCLQPAACTGVLPPPYIPPPPSYTPPSTPVSICTGIPDGGTACVNPASIAICKNGSPVYGTQPCPLGTVCSGNACVSPKAPAYSNVCAAVPDTGIACTSASQFVTCLHNSVYTAPLNCPQGTVCCGNACTYASDPVCAGAKAYVPSSNPVPPPTIVPGYTVTSVYSAVYSTVAPTKTTYGAPGTTSAAPAPAYTGNVCAGVADTAIACINSQQFVSCMNNAVFTAPLSCQPGTVCCGNACRYASDPICSAAPQVPSYTSYAAPSASPTPSYQSPPPVYSVGASSSAAPVSTPPSTPYSTDAPTYSIYSTPVYGTAAAPSTASSTPSYGTPSPSPVTTPSATPTPYSAPPTSYGTPSPASTPSTTPSYGTASAASSSAMAASSATPTYGSTPSSTPPAPVSTPVYVPPSATSTQNATAPSASPSTYNNCVGVADYQPSCTGPTTYKYCVSNAYVANQQSISCGTGSVCCPATGLCDVAANCPSYSATAPGATTYPSGQCKAGNASMYCTSSSTFTLCTKDGATYPNMKCAAGTVCCPTTNTCDFMYNCPALGAATKKASSSNPNQCAGVPSNESLCSQDQTTVLQCVGGEVAASRDCSADGMFCCDSTKQCAAYGDCPSLCSASANAEGSSGTCRDPFTFVVCQYGSLVIQVPCIEGMACCGKKNKCVSYSGPDGDDQWARTCQ